MTLIKAIYIVILLILFPIATAQASGERDLIIQKTMDCVDGHLQQNAGISWNDVCDMPESSYQEHTQIVNQQLDQAEENAAPHNAPAHYAAPQILTPDAQIQPKKSNWNIEIAPETSYIKYVETVLGSTFIKDKGYMAGVNGNITYHAPVGSALNSEISDVYRLEGMFLYGKVNYYGGYQNADGSTTALNFYGINDYLWEIRSLIGKDFNFDNPSALLRPYVGLGYRSLFDQASAIPNGGYDRLIQYFYVPIGAEVTTHLNHGWSIGATAEYDFFIHGFVTSYTGALPGYGNIVNNQNNGGYGLRGSIKLTKNFDHFNLYIEPYVRYWNINASRSDSSDPFEGYFFIAQEPNNTSLEMGGKLGIEF